MENIKELLQRCNNAFMAGGLSKLGYQMCKMAVQGNKTRFVRALLKAVEDRMPEATI